MGFTTSLTPCFMKKKLPFSSTPSIIRRTAPKRESGRGGEQFEFDLKEDVVRYRETEDSAYWTTVPAIFQLGVNILSIRIHSGGDFESDFDACEVRDRLEWCLDAKRTSYGFLAGAGLVLQDSEAFDAWEILSTTHLYSAR